MKTALLAIVCGAAIAGCDSKPADVAPSSSTSSTSSTVTTPVNASTNMPTTQPDNSGINTRDRAPDAATAGMQGESKADIDLTAQIRSRVVDAKLSTNAENSKIVTQNGKVTLRGPVNTQDEKDSIGKMASDVAGQGNVDNELEVKPNGQ